jgi:hypothetical protein
MSDRGIAAAQLLDQRPATGEQQSPRERYLGARLLLMLAWAYGVLPSLLQVVRSARPAIDVSVTVTPVPIAARATQLLVLLMMTTSGAVILQNIRMRVSAGALAMFLAPWALMMVLTLRANGEVKYSMLLFPLVAGAFWTARVPLRVLSTIGVLTVVTAVISLVMGKFTSLGVVRNASFADKALVGDGGLLAGPFTHPNALGLALVIGLPALFLVERTWVRRLGVLVILVALVWCGARTSLAAAILVLLVAVALRKPTIMRVRLVQLGLVAGAVAVCWVPLHAVSPSAYNNRGQVWLGSREVWRAHSWLGAGPDYYRSAGVYANELGRQAFHGHNLLIHLLTTGGVVAVAVVSVFLLETERRAIRLARGGETFPLLFLVAFAGASILEVVTDFRTPSGYGVVAWISMAAIFFAREVTQSRDEVEPGIIPVG